MTMAEYWVIRYDEEKQAVFVCGGPYRNPVAAARHAVSLDLRETSPHVSVRTLDRLPMEATWWRRL
jgi:lipocalin